MFYCPAARKGAFDYASQWQAKSKGSNSFSGQFRIGYYQRIVDSSFPVPGQLKANEGKLRVVMCLDRYIATCRGRAIVRTRLGPIMSARRML